MNKVGKRTKKHDYGVTNKPFPANLYVIADRSIGKVSQIKELK